MPTIVEMKLKRSRPERFLLLWDDGTETLLAPETVLKYQLAVGSELEEVDLLQMLAEDEVIRAKDQALRYLEIRPHSERELYRKLRRKRYNLPAIEAALDALRQVDLINDTRFARQFVESEMRLRPVGRGLLKQKLRERGIPDTIIEPILEETFRHHSEQEIAQRLTEKWLKRQSQINTRKRKAALVRFLQSKGFNWEVIQEILETLPEAPPDH